VKEREGKRRKKGGEFFSKNLSLFFLKSFSLYVFLIIYIKYAL